MFIKPAPTTIFLLALTIVASLSTGCTAVETETRPARAEPPINSSSSVDPASGAPNDALPPLTFAPTTVPLTTMLTSTAAPPQTALPKPLAGVPAVATLATAAPTPPTTSPPDTAQPVQATGLVMQVYSNGDFVLNDGHVTLRIVMQTNTSVRNLRGSEVIRQYIQASKPVQVTGLLTGTTMTAQTVIVQTTKDGE